MSCSPLRSALLLVTLISLMPAMPAFGQSQLPPAAGSAPEVRGGKRQLVVIGEKAVVYSAPSLQSRKIGEFRARATVVPVRIEGDWAEIDRLDHGYIPLSSLVDPQKKREERGSFDLSESAAAGSVACAREKELEEELRRKDDRIRELEGMLDRQRGIRPELPAGDERRAPLGAVTPRSGTQGEYDSRNTIP